MLNSYKTQNQQFRAVVPRFTFIIMNNLWFLLIMLIVCGRCLHCGQDIAAVLLTLIVYSPLLQPATAAGGRASGLAGGRGGVGVGGQARGQSGRRAGKGRFKRALFMNP